MAVIGSLILYLGLLFLSLSLEKHYKQVFTTSFTLGFKKSVTFFGWALLFISIALYIHRFGVGLGITYWLGIVTPIVVFIAMLLTYIPKALLKISAVVLISGIALTL